MPPLTTLDLFSGAAGGWTLGMERAGFQTLAACELDDWRRRIYGINNPGARLYRDVADITAARLLADLGRLPFAIVGSPPCQDISAANVRGKGIDGDRSGNGFDHFLRLTEECRPRWAAAENSPSLRTRGADRVLARLEALGYAPIPLVVGAWHAGHLHRRQRVWILAYTDDPSPHAVGAGAGGWSPHGGRLELAQAHAGVGHPADADEVGGPGRRDRDESGEEARRQPAEPLRVSANPGRGRQLVGSDRLFPEDPPWFDAGARLGRSLRAFAGLPSGALRLCCSALGDAVVPQLSYAIGRAILKVEAEIAADADFRIAA